MAHGVRGVEVEKPFGISWDSRVADQRITSVCVGACQPAEIEHSLAAFQAGPLPADLHQAMEKIASEFERLN